MFYKYPTAFGWKETHVEIMLRRNKTKVVHLWKRNFALLAVYPCNQQLVLAEIIQQNLENFVPLNHLSVSIFKLTLGNFLWHPLLSCQQGSLEITVTIVRLQHTRWELGVGTTTPAWLVWNWRRVEKRSALQVTQYFILSDFSEWTLQSTPRYLILLVRVSMNL